MKALATMLTLVLLAVTASAQQATAAKPPAKKMTGKEKMAMMQMMSFGGYVNDTRNQKGSVVIVNAQSAADKAWFDPVVAELCKFVKVAFSVKDGKFSLSKPELPGEACVFVVDDPALPMSLAAPEARWTLVNVAPLKAGAGEKPQFFKARVQKQLMRSLSYLMGATESQYPMCLTGCVTKPEDLDQYTDFRLPVDVLGRFEKYVKGYGVIPYRRATYKQAVQEGWAAQPTNKYQKAIWDGIHTLPTKPIEIKPETK